MKSLRESKPSAIMRIPLSVTMPTPPSVTMRILPRSTNRTLPGAIRRILPIATTKSTQAHERAFVLGGLEIPQPALPSFRLARRNQPRISAG